MIDRKIYSSIINSLKPGKVILLLGARRTGKTVILNKLKNELKEPLILLNGEDFTTTELLERRTVQNYKHLLGNKRLLLIDEAQKIPEVGIKLKLMIDEINNLKIIITGSSAFNIQNYAGEPLTGRKFTFNLFPLSEQEISNYENIAERKDNLFQRLVFGSYPELYLLKNKDEKIIYLKELLNTYLLKDILAFERIKNSSVIFNLLRLLAYQVGSEVSLNELANSLQINKHTVNKYLDLLTKVFILFRLQGYSRNLRKEVVKSSKWYFFDNGIRNAIIANFNPINSRNDIGILWENYLISERFKFREYNNVIANQYFWRTYDQQEIDLIEEREGKLYAYDFKWKENKVKPPSGFIKNYANSSYEIISQENYFQWIT